MVNVKEITWRLRYVNTLQNIFILLILKRASFFMVGHAWDYSLAFD